MKLVGSSIVISRSSMNKLYHGSHSPWEVLRNEGALLVVKHVDGVCRRIPSNRVPDGPVVGIDIMEKRARYLTTWRIAFMTTIGKGDSTLHVSGAVIDGLPRIVVASGS